MPTLEAPCLELGSVPQTPNGIASPSPSEDSSVSSVEPPTIRATPLFRALTMPLPEPEQPRGQEELERRLPGYRRIVIPRELTLIELLKESSGARTDEEVLQIREAKLRVVADRVGLRRLDVLVPRLRSLTLDGSAIASLRDLGIGLVHLKTLSINRCGLYSLDGVWGLGALRQLSAAGNKLQDLQPLAALQKLHTLNLSDNPISDASRLWTLGMCGSLRRLTLDGTPAAGELHYRAQVASALPMLLYLDDLPMLNDVDYDSDGLFGLASSEDESDAELDLPIAEDLPPAEPELGPSTGLTQYSADGSLSYVNWIKSSLKVIPKSAASSSGRQQSRPRRSQASSRRNKMDSMAEIGGEDGASGGEVPSCAPLAAIPRVLRSRRPATTECAGARPARACEPRRPRTAHDRPAIDAPTRLQILNTLMDEEWRCSGSKLTSHLPVCGNLAQALRRSTSTHPRSQESELESMEDIIGNATRVLADEIPRAPVTEDWIKFKEETGIEIHIDFNRRTNEVDPSKAIERLEHIEKETMERFKSGDLDPATGWPVPGPSSIGPLNFNTIMQDFEQWKANLTPPEPGDVDSLFNDLNVIERNMNRFSDNGESRM